MREASWGTRAPSVSGFLGLVLGARIKKNIPGVRRKKKKKKVGGNLFGPMESIGPIMPPSFPAVIFRHILQTDLHQWARPLEDPCNLSTQKTTLSSPYQKKIGKNFGFYIQIVYLFIILRSPFNSYTYNDNTDI
ncbi:hypothetical protein F5Y11DRAFT_102420 [Daldinia sp. FL1419]|nr:hypothetical protein F5Y11DRAFT_102420 [Daldinia sp. FL1419]